jgi:hypothetical protein
MNKCQCEKCIAFNSAGGPNNTPKDGKSISKRHPYVDYEYLEKHEKKEYGFIAFLIIIFAAVWLFGSAILIKNDHEVIGTFLFLSWCLGYFVFSVWNNWHENYYYRQFRNKQIFEDYR